MIKRGEILGAATGRWILVPRLPQSWQGRLGIRPEPTYLLFPIVWREFGEQPADVGRRSRGVQAAGQVNRLTTVNACLVEFGLAGRIRWRAARC